MINQGNNVPDKTIAIFTDSFMHDFENKKKERLSNIIDAPPKKEIGLLLIFTDAFLW